MKTDALQTKTLPALCFNVDGKHFQKGSFSKTMMLRFPQTQIQKDW